MRENIMKASIRLLIVPLLLIGTLSTAFAHSPPSEAKVFFANLEDGAVVSSPLRIEFGIQGYGITPAGTKGKIRHTAGHHHLLLDAAGLPSMDEPIPEDSHHLHFDQGETETVLELSPGKHTLQLLLGDEEHEPQAPPLYSDKITVTVE